MAEESDMNEITLSIDETNKIRQKLGLKPLNAADASKKNEEKRKHLELAKKEEKTKEILSQLDKMKKKREASTPLGKSLGEELAEQNESASDWVSRLRTQPTQIKQEQLKAEKTQKLYSQYEDELNTQEEEPKKSTRKSVYSSKQIQDLKVSHKLETVKDTSEPIILTLKDAPILKDGDLNEEEDVLENIQLREKETLAKHKEMKKKKSRYDDKELSENRTLLAQYDEPAEEKTFALKELAESKEQTKNNLVNSRLQSLLMEKNIANEYYSPEEMVQFKKKSGSSTKKQTASKKLRKKESTPEIVQSQSKEEQSSTLEPTSKPKLDGLDPNLSSDHGSRSQSTKLKKDEEKAEKRREQAEKGYARALQKASEETKALFDEEDGMEEDDLSLLNSLSKLREQSNNAPPKKETPQSIAARIQEAQKKRQQQPEVQAKNPLIFTATTEFVKGIQVQSIDEILNSRKNLKRKAEKMEETEVNDDREDHEKMIKQQALKENKVQPPPPSSSSSLHPSPNKKQKVKEEKPSDQMDIEQPSVKPESTKETGKDDLEEKEKELEEIIDEPLVGSSMADAIKLLKRKGTIPEEQIESFVGRKSDKREDNEYFSKKGLTKSLGDSIRLEHVDEHGRRLTPKEAFRILSHRFHGIVPGKNKREKRMRQLEEERKRIEMATTDTPLGTTNAMRTEMEKRQTPFIVLSGKPSISPSPAPSIPPLIGKTSREEPKSTHAPPSSSISESNFESNESSISANAPLSTTKPGGFKPGQFREFKLNLAPKKK